MNSQTTNTRIDGDEHIAARRNMIANQIRCRGVRSARVLRAMEAVPRHLFVPQNCVSSAYADEALPIGKGQTISQLYVVASVAESLALEGCERVLEVGAGSGYLAAVLSHLAREVISVEAIPDLAASARERMQQLGYASVRIEEGDGSQGWPSSSPYDAIVVSAASPGVPFPLIEQLVEGGRLVIPVGGADFQELTRIVKRGARRIEESLYACRFVPLVGRFGWASSWHEKRHEQSLEVHFG